MEQRTKCNETNCLDCTGEAPEGMYCHVYPHLDPYKDEDKTTVDKHSIGSTSSSKGVRTDSK